MLNWVSSIAWREMRSVALACFSASMLAACTALPEERAVPEATSSISAGPNASAPPAALPAPSAGDAAGGIAPGATPVMDSLEAPRGSAPPAAASTGINVIDEGRASFYGKRFHGRRTASGERFDATALTAAHRTLPFGTTVRVVNLSNGREVLVRINDRGPFRRDRVIDVSRAAADALDMVGHGVTTVRILRE